LRELPQSVQIGVRLERSRPERLLRLNASNAGIPQATWIEASGLARRASVQNVDHPLASAAVLGAGLALFARRPDGWRLHGNARADRSPAALRAAGALDVHGPPLDRAMLQGGDGHRHRQMT
jgi:hypothetical protein